MEGVHEFCILVLDLEVVRPTDAEILLKSVRLPSRLPSGGRKKDV